MTRCSPVITQQKSHLLWVDSLPSPVLQQWCWAVVGLPSHLVGLPSRLVGLPSHLVGQNHGSSWSGFTQWMQHVQKHFINQLFLPGVIPSHAWSIYSPAQVPNHTVPGTLGCQQALLWRFFPAQGCPPCCGAGLEHCRLRRDVPAWHGDQPDQQLQRPSVSPPGDTQKRKGKRNKKRDFRSG